MAEFSFPALRTLDKIYGFVGGLRGLRQLELEVPIQPVHDVSRQAELASSPNGGIWAMVAQSAAASTAGTINVAPYTATNARNGFTVDPARDWCWLLHTFGLLSAGAAADFTLLSVRVRNPDTAIGKTDGTMTTMPRQAVAAFTSAQALTLDLAPPALFRPVPILPTTGDISFRWAAGGAGVTLDMGALIWVGRKDVYPPGMY